MEQYIKYFYSGADNDSPCNGLLDTEVNITVTNKPYVDNTRDNGDGNAPPSPSTSVDSQSDQTSSAPSENHQALQAKKHQALWTKIHRAHRSKIERAFQLQL